MRTLLTGVTVAVVLTAAGPAFASEVDDEDRCVLAADRYSPMPEVYIAELLAAAADYAQQERCVPGLSGGADCQVGSPVDVPSPTPFGLGDARERWTTPELPWLAPGATRLPYERQRAAALSDGYARDLERPPRA